MEQPKTILLVDDHNLFREGLKMIIRRDSRFAVVAEAKDAEEGIRAALQFKPDWPEALKFPARAWAEGIRSGRPSAWAG